MEKLYKLKESSKDSAIQLRMPTLCKAEKPISFWKHICDESELEEVIQTQNDLPESDSLFAKPPR